MDQRDGRGARSNEESKRRVQGLRDLFEEQQHREIAAPCRSANGAGRHLRGRHEAAGQLGLHQSQSLMLPSPTDSMSRMYLLVTRVTVTMLVASTVLDAQQSRRPTPSIDSLS